MKVGDYVRTKDGVIAKITDIIQDFSVDCDRDVFDLDGLATMEIPWNFKDEYIIKSAEGTPKGLLSLIEVGDIVNGYKVVDIAQAPKKALYLSDISQHCGLIPVLEKDINTILTHEQYERYSYKVGD